MIRWRRGVVLARYTMCCDCQNCTNEDNQIVKGTWMSKRNGHSIRQISLKNLFVRRYRLCWVAAVVCHTVTDAITLTSFSAAMPCHAKSILRETKYGAPSTNDVAGCSAFDVVLFPFCIFKLSIRFHVFVSGGATTMTTHTNKKSIIFYTLFDDGWCGGHAFVCAWVIFP